MGCLEFCVRIDIMFKKGSFIPQFLTAQDGQSQKKMPHLSVFREVSGLLLGFSLCD